MNINNIDYRSKYLKYKAKYVLLKELEGGREEGEGEDMPTMASKMSSKVVNAAASLNLMELNDLLPLIQKLDMDAKVEKKKIKKQAKALLKQADEAVTATSNAVSALEEVNKNPSQVNLDKATDAVEELKGEYKSFVAQAAARGASKPQRDKTPEEKQKLAQSVRDGKKNSKIAKEQQNSDKAEKIRQDRQDRKDRKNLLDSDEDADTASDMFSSLSTSSLVDQKQPQRLGLRNESLPKTKRN
jgi:hypothetical protein